MSRYLAELSRRILVFDGAMGTSIQRFELTDADYGGKPGCNEILVVTRPDVIGTVHARYLEVGCDVVETDTFGGNRLKLAEYGLEDRHDELNFAAARLARQTADRFSTPERPRFVAGSIGPTGMLPSSDDATLGAIGFEELAAIFEAQARPLVEGGCDLLLVETSQDILEVKAAVAGIERYFKAAGHRVPLQVQVTLDPNGRMLLGTDMLAAIAILDALKVDVIGLNCSTGPEHMRAAVRTLSESCRKPLSVIPNAGLPLNVDGQAVYPLEPGPLAEALREFVVRDGVAVVGGCCGTTPAHMAAVVEAVAGLKPVERSVARVPLVASAIRAVSLTQQPPPTLIGERINAQGSRRLKALLLAEDYDGVLDVAREQVAGGAHLLDVCVALTERADEAEQMTRVVKKLANGTEAPLVFDSTETSVLVAALRTYPGRAVVNSVNLESGRAKLDALVPHVVEHGAALVALTIDEQGMARTAQRKLEVAQRLHAILVGEYGMAPSSLLFDVLTFTLATGDPEFRDSARETLEGLRRIKEAMPGVLTVLGVSNLSFGLAPRARGVLNSVFLHHARAAGLDLAIVNPAHVVPLAEIPDRERALAEALVFNHHSEALPELIAHFEAQTPTPADGLAAAADLTEGLSVAERLHHQILHRRKDGVEELIDRAVAERDPVEVLNAVLLPAMKEVGDKFGAGELILPFVLQSAEVMKKAVSRLETYLERQEGYTKGKVVLATVYGDVHDIGKSLVNTILTNNGYTVHDLGKQVPVHTILEKALEVKADAIGLSALLVSTSKQMPLCVQELAARGLDFPVIIGGAAINRSFGRRIALTEQGTYYAPGVYYANDAFEGLAIMDALTNPQTREAFQARIKEEALAATAKAPVRAAAPAGIRSAVRTDHPIPEPPFWGHKVIDAIPLERVFERMDLKSLYRLSWGARATNGPEWERLVKEEFEPRLERLKSLARREGFLAPRVVYGYYPCQAEGDSLLVYARPEDSAPLARFEFPRQPGGEHLCLADYFAPVGSGRRDVVAFQAVTVGPESTRRTEALQGAGDYSEGYFLHGLSVEAAEALAEVAHRHIRQELNLAPEQGKRYSWGYPAIPELADHARLFEVLPIRSALGMELTEAFQLVPEQSTVAIVVHHPEARYFAMRAGEPVAAGRDPEGR